MSTATVQASEQMRLINMGGGAFVYEIVGTRIGLVRQHNGDAVETTWFILGRPGTYGTRAEAEFHANTNPHNQ